MVHTISAGVGERMQYLAHKYNDTTIRFILQYPGQLDANVLCAATKAVVESVDVLHASLLANARSARWQVNEDYEVSDYFTHIDCDGDPLKRKPSVQVCAASFDGTAELTILGDFTDEDLQSLQSFLHGMRNELESYANR